MARPPELAYSPGRGLVQLLQLALVGIAVGLACWPLNQIDRWQDALLRRLPGFGGSWDGVSLALLLAPLLAYYGISPGPAVLWLPLVLAVQVMFMIALSLLTSAVTVFFRDVRFLVPLVLQVWMYASPVIYPADQVPEALAPLYFLNPLAAIVDAYRRAVLFDAAPRALPFVWASASALALLVISYAVFKRAERRFADVI